MRKWIALMTLAILSALVLSVFPAQAAPNERVIRVENETFFSFTPNQTGYWTFVTSNRGPYDPRLWLRNTYGHLIAEDDDTAGDLNAIIKVHLVQGAEYILQAGFWRGTTGSYTLTVFMSDTFARPERPRPPAPVAVDVPAAGGTIQGTRDNRDFLYRFTPNATGFWRVQLLGDEIDWGFLDAHENLFGFNTHEESDFYMVLHLVAGATYYIEGTSWDWEGYTLEITRATAFTPWLDWEEYARWGLAIDFDAPRAPLTATPVALTEPATYFSFTPGTTGPFHIAMSRDDEDLMVIVTDTVGSFLALDGNWWRWDYDGMVITLAAGVEYIIKVSSDWDYILGENTVWITPYTPGAAPEDEVETTPQLRHMNAHRIPAAGGMVNVGGADSDVFVFTPNTRGSWTIELTGTSTVELMVMDDFFSFTVDESGWLNTSVSLYLEARHDYVIYTWVSWGWDDAFLNITPTNQLHPVPGQQTMTRRVAQETDFSFIPAETGYWIFQTTENNGDPLLTLLDAQGAVLATDDDGGEGLNALIKIHLTAGQRYTLRAGFFAGGGSYRLTVSRSGVQQAQALTVLDPPRIS